MRSRSLARTKGHGPDWNELDEVAVIECLTTGPDVELDRILWLVVVLEDLKGEDDQEAVVFETMLDPRIPIPVDDTLRHGVAGKHVVGQRHFGQIASSVHDLIGDRAVVACNVQFAATFLGAEMRRQGQTTFYEAKGHDVQLALYAAWGYRPTLSNAIARLGVDREGESKAQSNGVATARLAKVLAGASLETLGTVDGDRWVDERGDHGAEPVARPQLAARDLGGDPRMIKNKRQAAAAIDVLGQQEPEEVPAPDSTKWVWLVVLGLAALAAWLLR